jgi:hypothetical protein
MSVVMWGKQSGCSVENFLDKEEAKIKDGFI